jgi:hypothetical protein
MASAWTDQLPQLTNVQRWHQFWPDDSLSLLEKHHAIIRFTVYLSIGLCWYYHHWIPLLLILVIVGLSKYMYERESESVHGSPLFHTGHGLHESGIQGHGCTLPTTQNPYMNVTMADQMDGVTKPGACRHPEARQEMQRIEQDHIGYRDTTDLFDRSSSQRTFYTMPNTEYPMNQQSFLNYLYPLKTTCKEQTDQCNYFELLQAKRQF